MELMKSTMEPTQWEDYGYVISSSYRTKVINSLREVAVQTPTEIAKDCGIRINHISMVLNQLKARGLIECINEEARKGRLYRLTSYGRQLCLVSTLMGGNI